MASCTPFITMPNDLQVAVRSESPAFLFDTVLEDRKDRTLNSEGHYNMNPSNG
jgi:hypothetical protein